jgi:hypothetical protein
MIEDDGEIAPAGTPGAIVEIFKDGEAYLVELFGVWVKQARQGWIPSEHYNAPHKLDSQIR